MQYKNSATPGSNRLSPFELTQLAVHTRPAHVRVREKARAFVIEHLKELLVITAAVVDRLM